MGKKCIPGVSCIENMTLFILLVILGMIVYMYYAYVTKSAHTKQNIYIMPSSQSTVPTINSLYGTGISSQNIPDDILMNPYAPPLKNDGVFFPRDSVDIRGPVIAMPIVSAPSVAPVAVPINMQTRGYSASYSQIGILTRSTGGDMILPLMGRRIMNGRNKLQYYTISNTGNLNTKLPVSVNGKSCSGEYGCDEISNGDIVYVEGYNDTFRATVYENGLFSYIPVL